MGLDMYLRLRTKTDIAQLGYWRKDNHIHNWFITHCAGGVDDCEPVAVEDTDLDALAVACEAVLKDPERAEELLPCASGFFFGSTEYDEYYMESLKETLDIISSALIMQSKYGGDFQYLASW